MQWFRMYAEFVADPLIRMLAFEDQRHFVAALCLKAMGILDKQYPSPEIRRHVISSMLGLSDEDTSSAKNALDAANSRLRKLGLVDENWQPVNWDKRQFQSDSSADRTRKWREKRHGDADVTEPKRHGDVLEQNRTDTESEQNQKPPNGGAGGRRKTHTVPDDFQLTAEIREWCKAENTELDIDAEFARFRDHEFKAAHSDWLRAWRRWVREGKRRGEFARVGSPAAMMFAGKPVEWR